MSLSKAILKKSAKILFCLYLSRPKTVIAISKIVSMQYGWVTRFLKKLESFKLVKSRKSGRGRFYGLTEKGSIMAGHLVKIKSLLDDATRD